MDAALSYKLQRPGLPPVKLGLQLANLLDSRKVIAFDLYAGAKQTPLYYTQPGRSVFASVEIPL